MSLVYWEITARLLRDRFRGTNPLSPNPPNRPAELPPVAFLRPVKHGVPGLGDKAGRLIAAARPGDHVLFGVDNEEDLAECETACVQASPAVHARTVLCQPGGPPNPKIAKLIQLGREAEPLRPGHWIVTDSEALPDRAFMDAFRAEWHAGGAAALTAGYRFAGAKNTPQRLDHLPSLLTLWPGLAVVEWSTRASPRGLGFTLGACTGLRRQDLPMVGGWEAFGAFLAEDNRLGAALAAKDLPVRLSREVLALDSDPIGWLDWLRHQHRVAVTYRVCNPPGTLGMGLTHGLAWGLLLAAWHPGSALCWALLAAVAGVRIATARRNARLLDFPLEKRPLAFALLTLLASLAETAFWLAAWLPLPVRWGNRSFRVRRGGRLQN